MKICVPMPKQNMSLTRIEHSFHWFQLPQCSGNVNRDLAKSLMREPRSHQITYAGTAISSNNLCGNHDLTKSTMREPWSHQITYAGAAITKSHMRADPVLEIILCDCMFIENTSMPWLYLSNWRIMLFLDIRKHTCKYEMTWSNWTTILQLTIHFSVKHLV